MPNPLQLSFDFFRELTRAKRAPRAQTPEMPTPQRVVPCEAATAVDPGSRHDDDGGVASALAAQAGRSFAYELRRSPRRRSLSVEVHPDLRVIVRAPLHGRDRDLDGFLAARTRWIEAQLAYFRRQPPLPPAPTYSAGETHLYLGRPHALVLMPEAPAGVRIEGDSLLIGGPAARSAGAVQTALMEWYRERAAVEFTAIVDACYQHRRFKRYARPVLRIRAMRTRWGSLGPRRGMTLNLVLIQAPLACIEYVVMHELCHLRYHGHGKGFYGMLEAVLPDWRARKRALEAIIR